MSAERLWCSVRDHSAAPRARYFIQRQYCRMYARGGTHHYRACLPQVPQLHLLLLASGDNKALVPRNRDAMQAAASLGVLGDACLFPQVPAHEGLVTAASPKGQCKRTRSMYGNGEVGAPARTRTACAIANSQANKPN